MQTLKSFIFIILLFNSFNVLSKVCLKSSGASIPNSTFIKEGQKGQGKCTCNSGYSPSGFSGISISSKNEFNKNAKCTEKNNWVVPLAIGGGIALVTGVTVASRIIYKRYQAYKTGLGSENRALSNDSWQTWQRNEADYLRSDAIYDRQLKGTLKLDNLTEVTNESDPLYLEQQVALRRSSAFSRVFGDRLNPNVKFDPETGANVLVDSDNKLLARWNVDTKEWTPVRGAERWRYSTRLGYKVISKNNENFLNPETNQFEIDAWKPSQGTEGYIKAFREIPSLRGSGSPIKNNISDNTALDADEALQLKASRPPGFSIKNYNDVTRENIMVDKEGRLYANWDRVNKEWVIDEGAERWRYSETLGHDVISTVSKDGMDTPNFLNPSTGQFEDIPTDSVWRGQDMEGLYAERVESTPLKGTGDPLNVTSDLNINKIDNSYDPDVNLQVMKARNYSPANTNKYFVQRNVANDENVLVDADKRQLAEWDRTTQEWNPVEGASRWRFSKTFRYKVIANKDSNFYNPNSGEFEEIPRDNLQWEGSESEYAIHSEIFEHNLKGAGEPMKGLRSANDSDIDFSLQQQGYDFAQNKNIHMKYDPITKSNVIVDDEDRILARWNSDREWEPVDGSERWVHSGKFKYDVISTNEDASDYLNPNTGKIEQIENNWEPEPMESSDIFGADAAPAARSRVIAIVHQNRENIQAEIDTQNVDVESDITDFQLPSPLSPAVEEQMGGRLTLDTLRDLFPIHRIEEESEYDPDVYFEKNQYDVCTTPF